MDYKTAASNLVIDINLMVHRTYRVQYDAVPLIGSINTKYPFDVVTAYQNGQVTIGKRSLRIFEPEHLYEGELEYDGDFIELHNFEEELISD